VHTGIADCEFAQTVEVEPLAQRPGYFRVSMGRKAYTMAPQETTTGAVRLEDRRAGVVWIQIPAKSMLMDAKAGRRVVDACQHAEQRLAATVAGAPGIGIAPVTDAAGPGSAPGGDAAGTDIGAAAAPAADPAPPAVAAGTGPTISTAPSR
jgi:hypothetical protein